MYPIIFFVILIATVLGMSVWIRSELRGSGGIRGFVDTDGDHGSGPDGDGGGSDGGGLDGGGGSGGGVGGGGF
ncbi:hypothetical protein, partial [Saccharomonospora iraqiensis]|uniref:hypothetical protein n=1 Tax=Saccharomonospora iraqiensis TaxID=52698 RepID=UPI00022E20AB